MNSGLENILKKPLTLLLFGVLIGLLCSAIILIVVSPQKTISIQLVSTPTMMPLTVHVSGEVVNAGVYQLPDGSRIEDALAAAGGSKSEADLNSLNLASPVQDGQKINVARIGESPFIDTNSDPPISGKVNINTATQSELESLPGIGPGRAADIIAYRQEFGAFDTIEEIQKVPGIGPGLYETIQNNIFVSN